jgi:hypothetical protein
MKITGIPRAQGDHPGTKLDGGESLPRHLRMKGTIECEPEIGQARPARASLFSRHEGPLLFLSPSQLDVRSYPQPALAMVLLVAMGL